MGASSQKARRRSPSGMRAQAYTQSRYNEPQEEGVAASTQLAIRARNANDQAPKPLFRHRHALPGQQSQQKLLQRCSIAMGKGRARAREPRRPHTGLGTRKLHTIRQGAAGKHTSGRTPARLRTRATPHKLMRCAESGARKTALRTWATGPRPQTRLPHQQSQRCGHSPRVWARGRTRGQQ